MGNTKYKARRSYLRFAITRAVALFMALILLIGLLLVMLYRKDDANNRAIIETKEVHYLYFQKENIIRTFGGIIPDLLFLANSSVLADVLENNSPVTRQVLTGEYLNFLRIEGLYDRVSILDTSGMELVRVNYNAGQPATVPESEFQSSEDGYYFRDILSLKKNEVYVSRLELDTEREGIVQPLKPVIYFGTPVFDRSGQKQGALVLTYLGENLLNELVKGPGGSDHLMLLNSAGYYLLGLKHEDAWGFMLPEREQRKFGVDYPEGWAEIHDGLTGQFYTSTGLFTFNTIYPVLDSQRSRGGIPSPLIPSPGLEKSAFEYSWKLVLFIPSAALTTLSSDLLPAYFRLFAILALVAVAGTIVLTSAIVRRQRAEDNLVASEARFRAVAETANDAIVASDSQNRIVLWNPAAEAMFGYPASETIGMPLANLIPERLRAERGEDMEWILAGKNAKVTGGIIEQTGIRKDGYEFPAEMTFARWQTFEGLFRTAIIRNITERRRLEVLEAEIEARNREIAHLAEAGFLGGMAQELRTPLNTIIGFSQVLQGEYFGMLNKRQAEHIKNILDSSRHMLELINDMLDVRLAEKSRLELELTTLKIGELLRTSLAIMQEKALTHHITLQIKLSPALDELEMQADGSKLKQVLFNLLSNAIKFTPAGGMVSLESSHNEREVIVSILDTGIGIAPEERPRIFEKFYQVYDAEGKSTSGPGLGLTLAKSYIELHGGRIWVESEGLGKGSRFTFILPLKNSHETKKNVS